MSTKKNNTANTNTSATPNTAKNAVKEVKKVNLDKFKAMLESKNVEKTQKDRQHLYNYPTEYSASDLNGEKGKKFRQGLRNKLGRFENNVFVYAKTNQLEKLTEEVNAFNAFYKEHYRLNDFTVKSLSASEKNAESLEHMLSIIREVNSVNA